MADLEAKEIIAIASPLIKSVVDTFISPKLESFRKGAAIKIAKNAIPSASHFESYFTRTYQRVSIINTLVFNNSKKKLKDIYIPLTIAKNESISKVEKYKITCFPNTIIENNNKLLIIDSAGMGKSTLMKIIFMDMIDKEIGIPILIELRRLKKGKTIIKEILEQLSAINKSFKEDLLLEFIHDGGFTFILDGYDEIPLSERDVVTADVQNFINKSRLNNFILTSRPESALSGFDEFLQFHIVPLKKPEAYELIRKYDNNGDTSKLLIKKLQESDMDSISEFLTNPLLVSLLYTAFDYKQVIPFKKHLFYRQVYDANFETHDLTKGESYMHDKHTNLDIDDFHRVLRGIGFSSLKAQKIEFSKDEILNIISESKNFCPGLEFTSSDFLKDILTTVPIFSQDGVYYRWAHKSLQEYFACQFIYLDAKEQQSKILEAIYTSKDMDKYLNILDIYYDIDYKTFRNVVVYSLIKDYRKHISINYNKVYKGVADNAVSNRREITFVIKPFVFKAENTNESSTFDQKQLSSMLNEGRKYYTQNDKDRFDGVVVTPKKPEKHFFIHISNKKISILAILLNKKNTLVTGILAEKAYKSNIELPGFKLDNNYQLYEISDNPADKLNSAINFDRTNTLIQQSLYTRVKINEPVALDLIKDIENDLTAAKAKNFLLEGF